MSQNPFLAPEATVSPPPRPQRRGGTYGSRNRGNRDRQEARKAHGMMVVAACIYSLSTLVFVGFGLWWTLSVPEHRNVGLIVLGIGCVVGVGPLGTFLKRRWCLIPMYFLAVLSLLSIPFGTLASLLVFFNASKAKAIYR